MGSRHSLVQRRLKKACLGHEVLHYRCRGEPIAGNIRDLDVLNLYELNQRCRRLSNFSSMLAIVSGLNNPACSRLKRTWEQVNQRNISQLHECDRLMNSDKNWTNYRNALSKVSPPCVPFFGRSNSLCLFFPSLISSIRLVLNSTYLHPGW